MLLFGLVFIQIVAFGVVILILRKIMLGNTESAVNRLDNSYQEVNKKKEEIIAKIQQIEQEYQNRKNEAEKITGEMKDSAEKDINEKRDSTLLKARQEAERIVTEAIGMKEKIREEIKKEEQLKMIDYCEAVLNNTFKGLVTAKINDVFVDNFLDELKETDMSHLPSAVNEVEVLSAMKLNDAAKSKITELFASKLRRKIAVKETADPHVIAGMTIRFGGLVLDGSLEAKLRETSTAKKQKIEERT